MMDGIKKGFGLVIGFTFGMFVSNIFIKGWKTVFSEETETKTED